MDGQDLRAKGFDLIAFIPATKESDVSPAGIVPSGSDSSNDCAQTFPSRAIYEKILAETSTARVKKNTVQKGDASPTLGELATIVHEGRSRSTKQSMRKDPTKATQKVPPSRHQVLSAAETDDIKSVTSWDRALLTETIDDFGWTPLMCAAYAGSTSVVSYLIEHICNKQHLLQANHANSTAAVLAASQGHSEIVDIITSAVALTFRHEHPPEIGIVDAAGGACGHAAPDTGIDTQASDTETIFGDETDNDDGLGDDNEHAGDSPVMRTSIAGVVQPETESALTDTRQDDNAASLHNAKNANGDSIPLSKYVQDRSMSRFCPVCACDYTQSEDEHVSSIAHQMEAARTTSSARMPPFGLQPTNRGYQMLLQQGWEEGGLGAHGQGRLFPVKTVLKRDRRGVTERSTSRARSAHADNHTCTSAQARVTHFNPFDAAAVDGHRGTEHTSGDKKHRSTRAGSGRGTRERGQQQTRTNHPRTLAVRDRERSKRLRLMLKADHELSDDDATL